jgi:hypothetical protein
VDTDDFAHQTEAAGNGAKGASASESDFADGEPLGAIESKDGEETRRILDARRVEAVENLKRKKAGRKTVGTQ